MFSSLLWWTWNLVKLKLLFPIYVNFSSLCDFCTNICLYGICILDGIGSEHCKILVLPSRISPPQGQMSSGGAGAESESFDDRK